MLSIPELHDHIACDRVWSRRLQHWHDNMLLDMGMAAAAIHAKMAVLIIIISFLLDVLMLRLPVTSVYQPTSRYHDKSMLECCRNVALVNSATSSRPIVPSPSRLPVHPLVGKKHI